MATVKGGYKCEFTSPPPAYLQYSCSICKLILREPHQTSCCNTSFCRVCIERVEANNNPCPSCKKRVFNKFPDVQLQRVVNVLEVLCTFNSQGCMWVGLLGHLDKHLNLNPDPATQPEGCHFASIPCIYCFEPVQRLNAQFHQTEECEKRPARCEYCNYESTFADVMKTHNCANFPTLCHQCKQAFLRQDFQNHIDNECPFTPIDCEFKHVGCEIALSRKDMPSHLRDNVATHISLQAAGHKKLEKENEKLKKKVAKQEEEITKLNKEVENLRVLFSMFHSMIQPVQLTMPEFTRLRRVDSDWISTPFYSHPQGYKLCIRVHANGILAGKGTHISVYVHLMKGEFDDHLVWPFRGQINIQLLGGQTQHAKNIIFDDSTPSEYVGRVTSGERASQGWGESKYISRVEAEQHFLWNDCLIFRISIK